jgi:hypothetical protein
MKRFFDFVELLLAGIGLFVISFLVLNWIGG